MNSSRVPLMSSSRKEQLSPVTLPVDGKSRHHVLSEMLFNKCFFAAFFLLFMVCAQAAAVTMPPGSTIDGIIAADGTWKFPKLRTDSNGDYYTLYWDSVNSALRFVKFNGLAWEEYTSVTAASVAGIGRSKISYGNDYQASYAFDSNDNLHVVFPAGTSNLAASHDAVHGVYNGTGWSFLLIHDASNLPEEVSLALDAQDKVHAVYHVDDYGSGKQRLFYATNATGAWAVQEILSTDNVNTVAASTVYDTDELHDNYVLVDSTGKVSVVYRREDLQNLRHDNYYITDSSDSFTAQTPLPNLQGTSDGKEYRVGNVIVDGSDFLHSVYSNVTDSTAHYLTNETGSWVKTDLTTVNPLVTAALDLSLDGTDLRALGQTATGYLFQRKVSGGSWQDDGAFSLNGVFSDRFMIDKVSKRSMLVYENSTTWEIGYFSGPRDFDGVLSAAGAIIEPVNIPATAGSGSPVSILDFTITDGGTIDALPLNVLEINLQLSGTASANFSKLRFNLTGCGSISGVAPVASTVSFTGAVVNVADGSSTTCTVQAYWDSPVGLVDNQTIAISVNGYNDLVVDSTMTQMTNPNNTVTTGDMKTTIVASKLAYTTQPAGSVSGVPLTTQPVVTAQDILGNIDVDFTGAVILSSSAGSVTNNQVNASAGVAVFTNLIYTATADKQSFTLTADESGTLAVATSLPVISEVVATKLMFTTQPGGSVSGAALATQPVIDATDANDVTDIDFTETITLTESSAGTLSGNSMAAVSGRAQFAGLVYTATADQQAFILSANDEDATGTDLPAVSSDSVVADVVATKLDFTTQPVPLSVTSGVQSSFTTDPVVTATDAAGVVDTGFNDTVILSETGAGSAVFTNNTVAANNGVAGFSGLTINYTALTSPESFSLQANDQNDGSNAEGDLPSQNSATLTALIPPPSQPPPPDLTAASDSGSFDTDDITNIVTPTFDGTAQAGSTVTLTSSVNGTVGTATADGAGDWSITASSLSQGNHNMTVTAGNAYGTSPPSAPLAIIIDITAPVPPVAPDLMASSDSGVSETDNRTNDTTPSFTGIAEAGSAVSLVSSVQGIVGNAAAGPGGVWAITASTLNNTQHGITAFATDIAGNSSADSTALDVIIDAIAPVLNGLPADMVVETKLSTALVSWSEPTATDNVDGSIVPVQILGPSNNSDFPVGMTTITYAATDNQGNSTPGSFTVTVVQKKFPWWIFHEAITSKRLRP